MRIDPNSHSSSELRRCINALPIVTESEDSLAPPDDKSISDCDIYTTELCMAKGFYSTRLRHYQFRTKALGDCSGQRPNITSRQIAARLLPSASTKSMTGKRQLRSRTSGPKLNKLLLSQSSSYSSGSISSESSIEQVSIRRIDSNTSKGSLKSSLTQIKKSLHKLPLE